MPILGAYLSAFSLDRNVSPGNLLLLFLGNSVPWGSEVEIVVGRNFFCSAKMLIIPE